MLRISIIEGPSSTTLRLEGKLSGEWVAEARTAWAELDEARANKSLIADLCGVTFVDASGQELLRSMHQRQTALTGSGPFITEIIREVQKSSSGKRSKIVRALVLLLLVLAAIRATAQTAPAATEVLTLEEAIGLARANNHELRIRQLEIADADDDVVLAKLRRLPSISTDIYASGLLNEFSLEFEKGAFGDFEETGPIPDKTTEVTAERSFNIVATAQVTQPISQLYRINLGVRAKELNRKIASQQARKSEQEVVHDVHRAYYAILQAQSALEAANASIAALKELERILTDRVKLETALPADLMEVKASLSDAKKDAVEIENQLASTKEQLNLLLGRDVFIDFRVADVTDADEAHELDFATARSLAVDNRPELREAELKVKVAEYDRRIKKAERLPDVGAFVSYVSPFNVDVIPQNIAAAGFQITWEPFDWGRRKRELAQKERTVLRAAIALDRSRDAVQIEVATAFRELKEARVAAETAQLAAQAAQERLRVITNQFEQEAVLFNQVLDARKTVAETQHAQHAANLAFWNAKADLAKAIGED